MSFRKLLILIMFNPCLIHGQVSLASFDLSDCNSPGDPSTVQDRIIKQELFDDTLTIHVGTADECCIVVQPLANYKNDTLFLDYTPSGNACLCYCCYEPIYRLIGFSKIPEIIIFKNQRVYLSSERFKTYPILFEILNGDTINRYDKYGQKEGLHIEPGQDTTKKKIYYKYGQPWNGFNFLLNEEKSLSGYRYVNGLEYYEEYYPNGSIKRKCKQVSLPKDIRFIMNENWCNCWDINGKLIADTNTHCLLKEPEKEALDLLIYQEFSDIIIYDRNAKKVFAPENSRSYKQAHLAFDVDIDPIYIKELKKKLRKTGIKKIKTCVFDLE